MAGALRNLNAGLHDVLGKHAYYLSASAIMNRSSFIVHAMFTRLAFILALSLPLGCAPLPTSSSHNEIAFGTAAASNIEVHNPLKDFGDQTALLVSQLSAAAFGKVV